MNSKYKKFTLALAILIMLGSISYNLVNLKNKKVDNKRMLQNENKVLELEVNSLKDSSKLDDVKERKFDNGPLKYNNKSVPVLMYHSIDYEKDNELRVPTEKFREQMKYIKDNGYTTLTFNELYDFFINNTPVPEKSVVITFDDGYEDNYKNAYPILKEYGINATIFVITATIDTDKEYLTSEQLKEMQHNDIDIESHTVKHDKLNSLSYENQLQTLKDSKRYLEDLLNKDIKYIGYPFGIWNDDTIKAAKDAGYKMAFTTVSGWANKTQGIYILNRVYVSSNLGMNEFIRRLTNPDYNATNKKVHKN
nr:polysaccharide deacetylase family protein [Clostridium sp. DJ247]